MSNLDALDKGKVNQWLLHFFFANLIAVYALSYNYIASAFSVKFFFFGIDGFQEVNSFAYFVATLYIIITYISYFALLTGLTSLIPFFISRVTKKNGVAIVISIVSSSCLIFLIILDLYIFKLYHFHINTLILQMLFSQYNAQIFYLSPSEWTVLYLVITSILLVEGLLAYLLWDKLMINCSKWIVRFICVSILLFIVSFASTVLGYPYLIRQSTIFPYYTDIIRHMFFVSKENINSHIFSHYYVQSKFATHQLFYPSKPLRCNKVIPPLNVFVILIDSWRFDAMNEKSTPNIARFAAQTLNFQHHISGGNATQPGVFSFFYSMPASYWNSVLEQKKGPEIINQFKKRNYQFAVFGSANLHIPDFASTIFRAIDNLSESPTGSAYQRDAIVTKRFISFLKQRNLQQPIFSFVFYDAVHEYCRKADNKGPFQPEISDCKRYLFNNSYKNATELKNRYLNAVYFVDQQVAQLLKEIKNAHLLDNSIIIISSDHGEEFNDNGNGYWGHASNFGNYQIKVPFIMHWPQKDKQQYQYLTSHYDVVPTLMSDAFGCNTDYAHYSYGFNLFDSQNRYPIILSGNHNVSYLTTNTITNLFPTGDFEIQDSKATALKNSQPDNEQLFSILQRMNRFYHK